MQIRFEEARDRNAIRAVTELAFRDRPYADGDEQDVIERLRVAGALSVSLVAQLNNDVVGHVAFSPAQAADGSSPWFALGPVSVLPAFQGQGFGAALIHEGLMMIRDMGALGCILTGNPHYYRRFGFALSPANVPAEESAEFFMLKIFGDTRPAGAFRFHPAFYGAD